MALGGGRGAVIRQLMVESVVLSLVGGAAGLLMAYAGLEGLKALGGTTFAEWDRAELDLRTLGACFALAGLTGLLFSVLPAWQTNRIDVQSHEIESGIDLRDSRHIRQDGCMLGARHRDGAQPP